MDESSDEEAWFEYPSFSRQDIDSEVGQSLVDTNVRAEEDVVLEIVGAEDQSGTPTRRESTRVRVKPRRYREEEGQTIQEKGKLSPRERKRRQSLAKQRDKSTSGMGWILKAPDGAVRNASSSEAVMLEELVKK